MCVGTETARGFQFAESVVVVLAANGVRQLQIAESLTDNSPRAELDPKSI